MRLSAKQWEFFNNLKDPKEATKRTDQLSICSMSHNINYMYLRNYTE